MSIETVKMALDELRYVLDSSTNENFPLHGGSFYRTLNLLKQAIEQAEKQETICPRCGATLVTPYGWQSVANPSEWLDDLRGIDE